MFLPAAERAGQGVMHLYFFFFFFFNISLISGDCTCGTLITASDFESLTIYQVFIGCAWGTLVPDDDLWKMTIY